MSRGMKKPRRRTAVAIAEAEAAPSPVSIDGIEVIQTVQDMNHSVTLVADKPTVVRVYLSRPSGTAIKVRGQIAVKRATGPAHQVTSLNTAQIKPEQNGNLRAKREDIRLSVNFLLPASLVGRGQISVRVSALTNADTGESIACTNCATKIRNVTFVESPPLRVRLISLRYITGHPPVVHLPSPRDLALIKSWLKRAYPVARLLVSEATVEADIAPPFDEDDLGTCDLANAQLSAIRNLDVAGGVDKRTHYYGLVADSGGYMRGCAAVPATANPSAVGSGPTGPDSFGWDSDGSYGDWYTGHEIGHTFGRNHPGFCDGNSEDDLNYPFVKGQLSNNDGTFVGLDVGDTALGIPMKALPGVKWHDVMTYCSRQWMSSYTYEGIRQRLIQESSLGAGVEAARTVTEAADIEALEVVVKSGNYINIVATVNMTKSTGKIRYVNPVSDILLPKPPQASPVFVRLKTAGGDVIEDYPVEPKLDACADPGKDQTGIVDAAVPFHPNAKAIDLVVNGKVADTYSAGGGALEVRNLRRADATSEAMSFTWDGSFEESANIAYNVQVSTDDGQTWRTIAVGRKSPEAYVDKSHFLNAKQILVRVIATDGFSSEVVTSETYNVDDLQE